MVPFEGVSDLQAHCFAVSTNQPSSHQHNNELLASPRRFKRSDRHLHRYLRVVCQLPLMRGKFMLDVTTALELR
jgi:hypothetical protein